MRPQLALALLLLASLLGGLACGGGQGGGDAVDEAGGDQPAEALELPVDLYFPAAGGSLRIESRTLLTDERPEEQVRAVLTALLAGPEGDGLVAPLPDGVSVGALYLTDDGIAFVDLEAEGGGPPPAGGSRQEMQIVYSLVNSITLNVPQVRRVVLLWNGNQPESFGGHLDTRLPLAADTGLVRR